MSSENYGRIMHSFTSTHLVLCMNQPDVAAWDSIIAIAYRFGVRIIEFSHTRDASNFRLFRHLVDKSTHYAGLQLGAGTVLNAKAAEIYLKHGAQFIASPFLHDDVAMICKRYDKIWIPGCHSVSEVKKAKELSAKIVSILPGNENFTGEILSYLSECPDMLFMPSAAFKITEKSLDHWMKAGAACIRMSVSVWIKEALENKDWNLVERNIYTAIAEIREGKKRRKNENWKPFMHEGNKKVVRL